jgi:hypothetical protein
MSTASPYDPYRTPTMPAGSYVPTTTGKPQLLSAVCVVCLVLGGLGLFNSFIGAVQLTVGAKMQEMFQPKGAAGMPPEMQKAQDEFQTEIQNVEKRFRIPSAISLSFRCVAAILLLIGGIRALGLNESGRKFLLVACVVAICFELGHAVLQSIVTAEMMTAVNSYVEGVMGALPQGRGAPPKGFTQMMQSWTKGLIMAAVGFTYALVLLKAGFYLFTLIYLQKAHIRSLFTDKIHPASLA